MTTGNTGEIWRIGPISSYRYGEVRSRSWSGGDAITASTPRASYPTVSSAVGPKRARAERSALMQVVAALRKKARANPKARSAYEEALRELYACEVRLKKATADELSRRADEASRKRRLRRLLPPKPYTMNAFQARMPGLLGRHVSWPSSWSSELIAAGFADYFPSLASTEVRQDQRNAMMKKIQQKAYGSGFNPLVFLAEGRQALDMIFNAAYSIHNALIAVRHGNLRAACYHLRVPPSSVRARESWHRKNTSDRWLELQYGWLPLLGDAEEGAKFLAEAVNQPYKYRDKLVARRVYSQEEVLGNPQGVAFFRKRMLIIQHQIIIYGYTKAPTGVGLYGVAETAWEKLPWSFVVDWFVPISELLRSLKTANQISGTVVETVKINAVYLEPTMAPGYQLTGTRLPIGSTLEKTTLKRTVSEDLKPLSSTDAVLQSISNLKEAMSWRRAANAVALLTQRTTKSS